MHTATKNASNMDEENAEAKSQEPLHIKLVQLRELKVDLVQPSCKARRKPLGPFWAFGPAAVLRPRLLQRDAFRALGAKMEDLLLVHHP